MLLLTVYIKWYFNQALKNVNVNLQCAYEYELMEKGFKIYNKIAIQKKTYVQSIKDYS